MHIPDGILDARTALSAAGLAAAGLSFALHRTRRALSPRKVPLLGLAAAFIFAAQMLNFPVAGGTSGHLIGATLAAVLLGPSAAVIVISCVLIVQCFLFADGGIIALGANIFNMGMVSALLGWGIYSIVNRAFGGLFGKILAATFAAWCSTVAASIVCAGELAASGVIPWHIAFPAMAGVHSLIGIGEGVITALVLSAISANRPDLIVPATTQNQATDSYSSLVVYGSLIALGLALFVSPYASSSPDGLDKTAADHGFESKVTVTASAPMPDYKIVSITNQSIATGLAGALGTLIVFGGAWAFARALVARSQIDADDADVAEQIS